MSLFLEKAIGDIDVIINNLKTRVASPSALHEHTEVTKGTLGQHASLSEAIPNEFCPGVAANTPKTSNQKSVKAAVSVTHSDKDVFSKARITVGFVEVAEELAGSDKLYRCKVAVGLREHRQIIAGLRKHVLQSELQGRLVVVLLNLKTAKLAGEASEGMILAAVQKGEQYNNGELVEPLSPPGTCKPGDAVTLESSLAPETYPKEFKHWKKMLPNLSIQKRLATFSGSRLITKEGPIHVTADFPEGASIS